MEEIETDVAIVGAGPVGLTSALLLARLGLRVQVLERRATLHSAPQAHAISARSLEVFRAAGVPFAQLDAAKTRSEDMVHVAWTFTLAGPEAGRLTLATHERARKMFAAGPLLPMNISQHKLEPILKATAEDRGVPMHFQQEWLRMEREGDRICSSLKDHATGRTWQLRSRFLLGCDGANSPVRRALGINMVGPESILTSVNIHFEGDLRSTVEDRPALLYWNLDPEEPGTFIAHDIDSTWVYWHPYDPENRSRESFTEEECRKLLDRALGTQATYTIRSIDPWTMTAQVAERFGDDRVFLVGDAVHRFPPTGGMGLNAGVADAFNLAWKLAAVHRGTSAPELLDTYVQERQPVAQAISDQSYENHRNMGGVLEAIELDPELSTDEAREKIRSLPGNPERQARVQEAIDRQQPHFDMIGLDQGARYAEGALVPDEDAQNHTNLRSWEYESSTRPGSRLPHAWLERHGERLSTLDLAEPDQLVLLTSEGADSWRDAASKLGIPYHVIGPGQELEDPDGQWQQVREVSDSGAVLVRPDQHVGWRAAASSRDPHSDLDAARSKILRSN